MTASNYAVGGTNFISASRQGNFRDLEVKNSSNTATILLTGDGGTDSATKFIGDGSELTGVATSGGGGGFNWTAQDGTKNISDTDRYTGYTVSASSQYADVYSYENAVFHSEGYIAEDAGMWISAVNTYSGGSYSGSVSTNSYNGEWIQINFGKKVKVYSYGIRGQTGSTTLFHRSPGGYKLFGSNDGSSWTDVHTGSASLTDYNSNYQKMKHNTLSTPVTYQYFRLVINSLVGTNASHTNVLGIYYLAFYGSFFDEVGISKKVSDLIDVDLTAPSDGEALIYDASIGKWKPGGNAALNFAPNVVVCYNQDTSTVDGTDRWRRFGVAQGSTTGGLEVTITPTTLTSKIKLSKSLIH